MKNKLIFQKVKETRDHYFVEYAPPCGNNRFAILELIFLDETPKEIVIKKMETEAAVWAKRYPIPTMVSSFDCAGTLIQLDPLKMVNHLFGLPQSPKTVHLRWEKVPNNELPANALDNKYLKSIYPGIPCKSSEQLHSEVLKHAKEIRIGRFLFFAWLIMVPALILILDFIGKWQWLSILVFAYSLWKAMVQGLKFLGKWKPSKTEAAKQQEEIQMRYHHYHCKQNPAGFQKLVAENFERELNEDIRREAAELKRNDQIKPNQS